MSRPDSMTLSIQEGDSCTPLAPSSTRGGSPPPGFSGKMSAGRPFGRPGRLGLITEVKQQVTPLLSFLIINFLLMTLLVLASKTGVRLGWLSPGASRSIWGVELAFVRRQPSIDSWRTMLPALRFTQEHPEASVYQAIFFERHIKFQYPLTALLPFVALQKLGFSEEQMLAMMQDASWISVWLVIGFSTAIGLKVFRERLSPNKPPVFYEALSAMAIIFGGLCFYPFMKGYQLGQAQTFLTLGFAISLYGWLSGWRKTAGAVIGVMSLVKPQYLPLLLWALFRKQWGACTSGLACTILGVLVSLMVFGWSNNIEYLQVLQTISRHGESYLYNHSMNGTLNRLLFNGNLYWEADKFAPFHPVVYLGTVLSALAILSIALAFPWRRERGRAADFACMAVATTIASPVAWEHHYGILYPIFVWLWFSGKATEPGTHRVRWVAVAYVLASNFLSILYVFAAVPIANLLVSYLYAAGLLLFGLLLRIGNTADS
jgi:hypothetical protein